MKNIFITGGAGFVGSAWVSQLVNLDFKVTVFDNFSFGNKEFLPDVENLNVIAGDIRSFDQLGSAIKKSKPQIVAHLAAIHFIPHCNKYPIETCEINISGTRNLLDILRNYQPEKLLYISTVAVYPILSEPHKESDRVAPVDIYGISKLAGEDMVQLFFSDTKIPSVIVRLSNAYGPNETNPHLIPAILEQLQEGERILKLGNLEPRRDFVHTTDIGRGLTRLINKYESGCDVFNLASGRNYSVREIVSYFSEVLAETLQIEQESARKRKVERPYLLVDIEKIKSFLDWKAEIDIKTGLRNLTKNI